MDPPPAYAFMPPSLKGAPAPWIGHMDATSAAMRAFDAGLLDGQRLCYGLRKPLLGGRFTEDYYLRGIAYGMVDNGTHNGDYAYAESPATKALAELPPSPWLPTAILPFPSQPDARPPQHARPLPPMSARPLPHIPLPDCVDRTSITEAWEPHQRQSLFNSNEEACWVVPEDARNFPASTQRVQDVVEGIAMVWRAGTANPRVVQPADPAARAKGAVYVTGEPSWIRKMKWSRVVSTPWMNLLVFPNRPRHSHFAGTFSSDEYGLLDHGDALCSIREALDDSDELADICAEQGVSPAKTFSSLEMEFVLHKGRNCWNVALRPPSWDNIVLDAWRGAIHRIEPEDGDNETMSPIQLECDICGCPRHSPGLCPSKAYEEWNGAIYDL